MKLSKATKLSRTWDLVHEKKPQWSHVQNVQTAKGRAKLELTNTSVEQIIGESNLMPSLLGVETRQPRETIATFTNRNYILKNRYIVLASIPLIHGQACTQSHMPVSHDSSPVSHLSLFLENATCFSSSVANILICRGFIVYFKKSLIKEYENN